MMQVWTEKERLAWAPPADITVSEWAELYRVLPRQSARPGAWRNRLTPYAVEVMDAFVDPRVEQITIMASVQSAKTESAYNMLGFAICQDPASALVVMPTLKTLKKVNRRLQSMLLASDELAAHLTGDQDDLKYENITLDRMEIHFATAGSESDLQFVEARILLLDEVDLYPPGAVKMAIDRSTTFWNRKIVKLSRPTTEEGHIYQEYQRSDQRRFWVPCPFCGWFQVLSFWQVKHKDKKRGEWPQELRQPEYILGERPARYECQYCQAEIDDADKPGMLAGGIWVPEGHPFDPASGEMAQVPPVSHIGFWWNALYSPFKNFSEMAAEFFETKDDPIIYRNFVTQWLAEPWQEIIQKTEPSKLLELCSPRPAMELPDNLVALTAGIDNQKRGFWVTIWAWELLQNPVALHQHLIRYGYVPYFEDLEDWLFNHVYRNKDGSVELSVTCGAIDTGGGEGGPGEATQTDQIYNWLYRSGRNRVFGIKGSSTRLAGGKKVIQSPGKRRPIPGGLWMLDTHALKESFWSRVNEGRVHFHAETGDDYISQICSEIKIRIKGKDIWENVGRRANHLLDASIYAMALAEPEWMDFLRWKVVSPKIQHDNSPGRESAWLKRSEWRWLK